jgi:hypothetical protein
MTGTDKLPLLAIGKSKKPRCFSGIRTLPCQYEANPKAWMNGELFTKWVERLDRRFRTRGKKIALVIDNAPSHPRVKTTNVEIVFLPPNTTAASQPMDQGIIKNLKERYKRQAVMKKLTAMDAGKDMPTITVADALFMARRAWDEVTPTTIQRCFRHCKFIPPDVMPRDEEEDDEDSLPLAELMRRMQQKGQEVCTADEYLSADASVATCHNLTDRSIINAVQGRSMAAVAPDEEEDAEEDAPV